jgi:hypothetical protein
MKSHRESSIVLILAEVAHAVAYFAKPSSTQYEKNQRRLRTALVSLTRVSDNLGVLIPVSLPRGSRALMLFTTHGVLTTEGTSFIQ